MLKSLANLNFVWGDVEGGAGSGLAGKDGGGNDIFHGFLYDAAHGASAHFGVVAFVYEELFGGGVYYYGDFLGFEGFVGGGNN